MSTDGANPRTPGDRPDEPESLAQLRDDCARMSARRHDGKPAADRPDAAAEPARPQGVQVPERSARLLDGMSDYGD